MLVVKVGGGAAIDLDAVCDDVAALARDRKPVVLVHGGSHKTNEVATRLGHPPEFVTSPSGYTSRRTDRTTLEIFAMVYCGLVNTGIVERLHQRGARAVGLAGLDGPVWRGRRKATIRAVDGDRVRVIRDDYPGTVDEVDAGLIEALVARGLVPVLTPPALSLEGEAINVDGDRAAAATAAALGARDLVILSDVPGLLADPSDPASLVPRVAHGDLAAASTEFARGRMRVKLLGAREALDGGVRRVVLGDATAPNPVLRALSGRGTVVE